MILNSGSTRLLSNLIRFTRQTSALARNNKNPIFLECRRIQNLNELSVRFVAISAKKKEEAHLNLIDKLEKDIYQLNSDVRMRRVFKQDFQNIFETLKQTGEMKPYQLNLLLKCCTQISFMCSEKERIQMAEDFWDSAKKLGVIFDKSHFNDLLNVYVANNHQFSNEKFLKMMEEAEVEPDLMTFRYLLRASCQQGDINNAKDLLDKMKNLNIPIDRLDFNSLILAYSKIGDFEKVNEIFNIMRSKELKPISRSYVYLLCGYIEHGKLEEFEKLFNELPEQQYINLTNWDLFEIIFTLAKKNQESYIDKVIQGLSRSMDYDKQVSSCIQRLLHEKLDSTALKLLETIDLTGRPFHYTLSVSKYFLDHFVWYRKPSEILSICQKLEERGYARTPLAYCLRKSFFIKDVNFFKEFIQQMKAQGIPVRGHYYWPMIIQESKKGNKEFLSFLKHTPRQVLEDSESVYHVILSNYVLSKKWETDMEQLSKLGIPENYIARDFMTKLLVENQIDMVDQLVATYPVHPFRLLHVFNMLFSKLASKPQKVEQVVNILYNLYHDQYLYEKTSKNSSNFIYFHRLVDSLLQKIEDKEIITRVLEAMLEKKMGLSPDSCSKIVETFPDQNVNDLISKLSDPNLKIELNETLLTLKSKHLKPTQLNKLDPDSIVSLKDCVKHMLNLAKEHEFQQALEFGENFALQNKEITKEDIAASTKIYRKFLMNVSGVERNEDFIKNCINLGAKLGILKENNVLDNFFILRSMLHSNYTSRAFEIFKEIFMTTGKPVLCEELLKKCISKGETEKVQQITDMVTETHSRNTAFSYLVFALANLGEIEKAQKVLDTPGFVFQEEFFLNQLSWERHSNTLKNLVQALKKVDNFDMSHLYKILVKHYARKSEVDEIQQLWLEIQKKNISDEEFLKQMSEFQQDKDVTRLYNSINININLPEPKRIKRDNSSSLATRNVNLEDKYLNAMMGSVSPKEATVLATKFASVGDVEKTCSLIENFSVEKSIQKIAAAFLRSGKVNEYFKFLDFFASKGDFITLNNCFKIGGLIPALIKSDEYFEKYKSLLLQCADETNFSNPVISCFVMCAKIPGKIADAEEIVDKYSSHFKDLKFSRIKETVEVTEVAEIFYENILSSKKLKELFSDHIHEFYNQIITLKYEGNEFTEALNYINQAQVDKVKDKLDKTLIARAEEKSEQEKVKNPKSVTNSVD